MDYKHYHNRKLIVKQSKKYTSALPRLFFKINNKTSVLHRIKHIQKKQHLSGHIYICKLRERHSTIIHNIQHKVFRPFHFVVTHSDIQLYSHIGGWKCVCAHIMCEVVGPSSWHGQTKNDSRRSRKRITHVFFSEGTCVVYIDNFPHHLHHSQHHVCNAQMHATHTHTPSQFQIIYMNTRCSSYVYAISTLYLYTQTLTTQF